MDRISLMRSRLNQRGREKRVTEQQLLEILYTLPPRPSYGVPPQGDDSHDRQIELVTLTPAQRQRLGLEAPPQPAHLPELRIPSPDHPPEGKSALLIAGDRLGSELLGSIVAETGASVEPGASVTSSKAAPQPLLRVRVHAIVCRNDDGKLTDGSAGQSRQELSAAVARVISATNAIYAGTGIELVFYPSADLEIRNDTRLNQDFIVPPADQPKLTQNPPLTRAEFDSLVGDKNRWSTENHRNAIAKQYPGKMVLLFAEGTTFFRGVPITQPDWSWCKKCQGLFYGAQTGGRCPAGGAHDRSASGNYALTFMHHENATNSQDNWRWCSKCQGLCFMGHNAGVCPAGGPHDTRNSGNYVLTFHPGGTPPNMQRNWRWCKKCQGLFFGGNAGSTCPAGAAHDPSTSGDYTLMFKHEQASRWVVSSPSNGGFSWEDKEFVKLSAWVNTADGGGSMATFVAHETGHYLHLWHPFWQVALTEEEKQCLNHFDPTKMTPEQLQAAREIAVKILQRKVAALIEEQMAAGKPLAQAIQVLNADAKVVDDTPPDDSGELMHYMNAMENGGDACGVIGTVNLKLKDGTPVSYTPDRSLVMSYFKGCLNFRQRFSPKQGQRMRNALIQGNRRHLVGVQLGDTAFPGELVCATWNPNTQAQFYTWNNTLAEFKQKLHEMTAKGMRLRVQQAYTVNGQTRYDGIWNPGTQNQAVSWGLTVPAFKAENQVQQAQSMRLVHFESYLLPDGQTRVNAIWNPGTHWQTWVQGFTAADLNAQVVKSHQQGLRITHLNAWNLPDGQVRYDALWAPGSHAQSCHLDLTAVGFKQQYGEMWGKDFKLLLLDAFKVGGSTHFAAVWNPDPGPQYVVWDHTREQVRAAYDEMWQQGLKLTSMSVVRFP